MTKAIAFYLPQYHSIPENDQWWGQGFTDWTTVKTAEPLFEGHYQPHRPLNNNYYNLLDENSQHWQVNLAKKYGLFGFCFYFYFFNGKTLLEQPLINWLQDKSLDFPFCLCWANENWTRRWDGLDDELLIKQNYSPKADRDFIHHITPYLKDPRYIRIDGRPLIIVYRPGKMPNPSFSASQWRFECNRSGVGEIYLAYTQSFDSDPPEAYGFDGAIQFPPIGIHTESITAKFKPLAEGARYAVHDYKQLIARATSEYKPSTTYTLFPGVCPGWDNTSRRGHNGADILQNTTPYHYQSWLAAACSFIRGQAENKQDEDLVFINAWNEWGEGCHLEPDQQNGYAYLEATLNALNEDNLDASADGKSVSGEAFQIENFAVIIHAFYVEVFESLLNKLSDCLDLGLMIYVTCPQENVSTIEHLLNQTVFTYVIHSCANHGRDVLPFLEVLPRIVEAGHPYLIKIHTKKTLHRQDGDEWLESLTKDLIGRKSLEKILERFSDDDYLGVIGPAGNVLPVHRYLGSNLPHVQKLLEKLSIPYEKYLDTYFVAGTMFAAKTDAMQPLLDIKLTSGDFETESGQTDGTLAHAVERIISIAAMKAGFHTSSIDDEITEDFQFALPTSLEAAENVVLQQHAIASQQPMKYETPSNAANGSANPLNDFKGTIDFPPQDFKARGSIDISGWCFVNNKAIVRINAWFEETLVGPVNYGISRPDVLSIYPEACTDKVGFHVNINFLVHHELQLGAESEFRLEIITEDTSFIALTRRLFLPSSRPDYLSYLLTRSTEYSFEDQSEQKITPHDLGVRTICFYLPQFHAIPENDHWWGRGFTEWVNVAQGIPLFPGHEQPRLPADLGFYDLRDPEVQLRQIAIAQHYGIEGFCYYIYWFGGRRLLETPTTRLLHDQRFISPFCLCWANENWTRRWDGGDSDILMAQNYSPQDDVALITEMAPYFDLPNYIRINGKPVFMVYNITLLPSPLQTAELWRERCIQLGIGEIYLVLCHSFTGQNPGEIGFDAAVEFPPLRFPCDQMEDKVNLCDPLFQGKVYDWMSLVHNHIKKDPPQEYPLIPSLVLGWDNVARKGTRGHIFYGANPKTFGEWSHAVSRRRLLNLPYEERFLFINAWNEWAEGTYLEPDRRHGFAYLNALAQGLKSAVRFGPSQS